MNKSTFSKLKKNMKIDDSIPKLKTNAVSMQESIPIYAVHEKDNLIEVYKGYYVKSYFMKQINYITASQDEQNDVLSAWHEIYNMLGDIQMSQTIINKTVSFSKISDNILLKETGDELDELRRDLNKVNIDRIKNGNNGIDQQILLTLGIHASSLQNARIQFKRIDKEYADALKKLGSDAVVVPTEDKLAILYDICNYGHENEFITKTRIINEKGEFEDVSSFDLTDIRSMGLDVKDIIGSSCINIYPSRIEFGDKYACIMQITRYGNSLKDTFYHNLSNQAFNMVQTLNVKPMTISEAKRMISKQLQLIREEIEVRKKENRKNEISEDALPPILLERETEALELMNDVNKRDEKFFQTSVNMIVYADSLEELKANVEVIKTIGRQASCTVSVIREQQEEGFISALPLAYDLSKAKRTFKTESLSMLLPFSNMELNDSNGIVYSQNAITKNLVCYDRINPYNLSYNGCIFGVSGSGKTYTAKLEQIQFRLKGHDVIIIDPEGEYGRTAKLLNGTVVKIAPGEKNCINPMDIYVDESDTEIDPVLEKADFILQLCEIILHSPFGLNSVQKTVIDECVHELYAPFYDDDGILHPISREDMPTLTDLFHKMAMRQEPEAREIAYALKLYSGDSSLNIFGGKTNVDTDSPYLVYDILKLGDTMKPVAMFIIINSIWNRIIRNRKLGKFTYLGIDEFHLLLQDEQTALAVQGMWKRFRKFGGVPTAMTQNIADLMANPVGSKILANSSFVILLNQQADDRELVKEAFHLSDSMVSYITNGPKGQGLLLNPTSGICIPFYGPFPKDTLINKAITSDMREIKKYEEEEQKKAAEEALKNA